MADATPPDREPAHDPVVFVVVDPGSPAAHEALAAYYAELDGRFSAGFNPGDPGAGTDDDAMRAPRGAFVIMQGGSLTAGCGAVMQVDHTTAEIKRMWVHQDFRGRGLGKQLLAHLEGVVAQLGYRKVVLDTNETLDEAIAMYRGAGYASIQRYNDNPYAHHWFAKTLQPD